MSDFLSRVAARAVGRAPAAQPRLPALFDPSPGAELELVGEGTPERTAVPAPPTDPRRRSSLAAAGPTDPGSPVERRPAPAAIPAAATQDADLPDATAKRPPSAVETRIPDERDRAVGPPPEREPAAIVPAPRSAEPVPAQAAVAAEPASPAALEAGSHGAVSSPATAVGDPSPSMRVHIGRLEVRANLQPAAPMPPAAPQRRRPDQPQGLSLTDYLRGKRGAG